MNYIILAALLLFPFNSLAASRFYSPVVDQGVATIEVTGEQQKNDDILLTDETEIFEANLRYAFSDSLSFGVQGVADQVGSTASTEYQSTGVEMTYQFAESDYNSSPVAAAIRFDYQLAQDSASSDQGSATLLFDYNARSFEFIVDAGLTRDFGGGAADDLTSNINVAGLINFSPLFRPGVAYFSQIDDLSNLTDFANQNNSVGGYVMGNLTENLYYEGGYLVGMSDTAPDNTYIAMLGYKIRLQNNYKVDTTQQQPAYPGLTEATY